MAYIGKQPLIGNFQVCDAISTVNGQAAYTLQVGGVNVSPETVNNMICSVNGVIQKPGVSYTVSGSTITFTSALVTGDVIDFIQILGNVLDLGVPSDNTVTTAKIADGAVTAAKLASNAVDTQALALFNASGSAPVYACRAWVNFDGTGTVAIRGSGNVSSITDNGTGLYTINFTTAMSDTNYSALYSVSGVSGSVIVKGAVGGTYSTSAVQILCFVAGGADTDVPTVGVSIFR